MLPAHPDYHLARTVKNTLNEVWLDYVNDYLSVQQFAKDYDLTVDQAKLLLKLSRSVHEAGVK